VKKNMDFFLIAVGLRKKVEISHRPNLAVDMLFFSQSIGPWKV
jgi:hypothetical protein